MLDVRLQALVDRLDHGFPGLTFLNVAIDTLLDEDLFQRGEVPFLFQLAETNFEFLTQQIFGMKG